MWTGRFVARLQWRALHWSHTMCVTVWEGWTLEKDMALRSHISIIVIREFEIRNMFKRPSSAVLPSQCNNQSSQITPLAETVNFDARRLANDEHGKCVQLSFVYTNVFHPYSPRCLNTFVYKQLWYQSPRLSKCQAKRRSVSPSPFIDNIVIIGCASSSTLSPRSNYIIPIRVCAHQESKRRSFCFAWL